MTRAARAALAALLLLGAPPARAAPAPPVTGVEVSSPHRLPAALVDQAIGSPAGRPLDRAEVRRSLDRLDALGLFEQVEVDAVPGPAGVRLRYRLARRPWVQSLAFRGDLGLAKVDLAGAAALAVGDSATPAALDRARRALQDLLRAEGFPGAAVEIAERADPETNARDVTALVAAGERARFGTVAIEGVSAPHLRLFRRALGFEAGDRYADKRLRDGIREAQDALRAEGLFEARVALEGPVWRAADHRMDVVIRVAEGRPTRVVFEGRHALGEKALRERLTFGLSGVVDDVEAHAGARQIESAYREAGYPWATVAVEVTEDDGGRVARFRIDEGQRATVERVGFTGNVAVTDAALRDQMQTRPPGLLGGGHFVQETLDRDLRVLLRYLRAEGYPEARVGPADVQWSPDRARAAVTIAIEEGPRVRVGEVRLDGPAAVPARDVLAALTVRAGQPWDADRAEEGRRQIERLYAVRGYHRARATLEARPRDGAMDLAYAVTEGPLTRVGRILVGGLTFTDQRVVLRELPFEVGSPFRLDDLEEARRRLAATRLFERADVGPFTAGAADFQDVEVTLREAKPWRLDFGAGYDTFEGLRGFIEVGHDNLFGTGRSVGLRERASQRGDSTALTYREPWVLGTAWQGEASLGRAHTQEIGYDSDRLGAGLVLRRELLEEPLRRRGLRGTDTGLSASLRYRYDRFDRSNVDPSLVATADVPDRQQVASVSAALAWELRDQATDPRRGGYHYASLELGGPPLGGQVTFVKARLETAWFVPWPPPGVLAMSARLGLAAPFHGSESLAIEDRFYAGGSTSIRGYREQRVGPKSASGDPTGGNAQLLLNLEWRFPIWRWIGGVVFFDAGTVVPTVGDLAPGELYPGTGAGLRIATPIGPVRFDVGYGLRRIPGEQPVQLYLTIGHAF